MIPTKTVGWYTLEFYSNFSTILVYSSKVIINLSPWNFLSYKKIKKD